MDRGAWGALVHRVAKSQILSNEHTQTHTHTHAHTHKLLISKEQFNSASNSIIHNRF